MGRVSSDSGADARRRYAGDTVISSRSANTADAPVSPKPFGRRAYRVVGEERATQPASLRAPESLVF